MSSTFENFTMLYCVSSNKTKSVLPAIAVRLGLAEFKLQEPLVTRLVAGAKDYIRCATDSEPMKVGLVVNTQCFAHVLTKSLEISDISKSSICSKTIVLELPESTRQFISDFAIQTPAIENIPDVNLRLCRTYLVWHAAGRCAPHNLGPTLRIEVRLLESDLSSGRHPLL
jgi:hypothetical protein